MVQLRWDPRPPDSWFILCTALTSPFSPVCGSDGKGSTISLLHHSVRYLGILSRMENLEAKKGRDRALSQLLKSLPHWPVVRATPGHK